MPYRGYVVATHQQAEIVRQSLADNGIPAIIVREPVGFGTMPRPILIARTVPQGWTRIRTCRMCRTHPERLTSGGMTTARLATCAACSQAAVAAMYADPEWQRNRVEHATPVEHLRLPPETTSSWRVAGAVTVGLLRTLLRTREWPSGIGAERAAQTAEALERLRLAIDLSRPIWAIDENDEWHAALPSSMTALCGADIRDRAEVDRPPQNVCAECCAQHNR